MDPAGGHCSIRQRVRLGKWASGQSELREANVSNRKRDFDAIKLTLFKNLKSGYVNECKIKLSMATRLFLWCRNASSKVFECMIEKYDGVHFSKFISNFSSKFQRHYFPIMNSGVGPQKEYPFSYIIYYFFKSKMNLPDFQNQQLSSGVIFVCRNFRQSKGDFLSNKHTMWLRDMEL